MLPSQFEPPLPLPQIVALFVLSAIGVAWCAWRAYVALRTRAAARRAVDADAFDHARTLGMTRERAS